MPASHHIAPSYRMTVQASPLVASQEALSAGGELEPILVHVIESLFQQLLVLVIWLASEALLDSNPELGEPSRVERGRFRALGFRRHAVRDAGAELSRCSRMRA